MQLPENTIKKATYCTTGVQFAVVLERAVSTRNRQLQSYNKSSDACVHAVARVGPSRTAQNKVPREDEHSSA
eukprot:3437756-Rhodomonas_salina.1